MSQFIEEFGTMDSPKWETKTLPEISQNMDSKRIPIRSGNRKQGKYPYYGASGIVDYVDDYIFDEKILLVSEDGANLKERVAPIAFSSEGKVWVNNHAHVLRFNDYSLQKFVEYYLNYNKIDRYLTGTAQPKLNQDKLNNIPIPFPPEKQLRRFDCLTQQADKSEFGGSKSQFIEMFGTINSPCDKMSTLGELCHIHRGGSPRPIKDYITTDANGLNWIKIGDTDDSMYIKKTEEKIKPSGLKKTRQVYAGDLLLSNSMSFGRPYILKINGCIHDGWLVLHIKDESILTQIYLCAYLSQKSTYEEMSKLAAGGVVQNLNSEIVKKLPVILPPMQKQLEYISILEQADKSEKCCEFRLAS